MAVQEPCWLTFMLNDLGESPRAAPVLFADNRAMILLCQEPRLVGSMKLVKLWYFLLHELQLRGQARVVPTALEANTAHILTKALQPHDHQRLYTQLGLIIGGHHSLFS
ncbi:unnamed protein product [Closterium sp. NIES-53]